MGWRTSDAFFLKPQSAASDVPLEMSTTGPASGLASQSTSNGRAEERIAHLRRLWVARQLEVDGASLADAILARANVRAA